MTPSFAPSPDVLIFDPVPCAAGLVGLITVLTNLYWLAGQQSLGRAVPTYAPLLKQMYVYLLHSSALKSLGLVMPSGAPSEGPLPLRRPSNRRF
jgi:hypothetical protein